MTCRSIKKAEKFFLPMEALFLRAFEERAPVWTCTGVLILFRFAFTPSSRRETSPRTSEGPLPYAPGIGVSISALGYSKSFDSGSPRFDERAASLVALRCPFLRPDPGPPGPPDGEWFEKELVGKVCERLAPGRRIGYGGCIICFLSATSSYCCETKAAFFPTKASEMTNG